MSYPQGRLLISEALQEIPKANLNWVHAHKPYYYVGRMVAYVWENEWIWRGWVYLAEMGVGKRAWVPGRKHMYFIGQHE